MGAGDDDSGRRDVLVGLGALVVITLVVGGVVSAMALGAAKLTGIGDGSSGGPEARPSLFIPSGEPTTSPEAYPDPSGADRPSPSESASPSASESPSRADRSRRITLQAFPLEVAPGERINLTGVYPSGEGATLQVQRFEGTWTDFSTVTARVQGGIYNTYVLTSRSGEARFRMLDTVAGRASNPVRVTIR